MRKFDQMFFVTLTERKDAPGGQWVTLPGFTTKGRHSYSSYWSMDGSQWDDCRPAVTVRPAGREVVATIPWLWTAKGPVKVKVSSSTGRFRSDMPSYSADRYTMAGLHTILPTCASFRRRSCVGTYIGTQRHPTTVAENAAVPRESSPGE